MPITARDAVLMMDQLKLARIKTGAFNLGNYMDAACIAAIAAELVGSDA
jgi:hypothetical protein